MLSEKSVDLFYIEDNEDFIDFVGIALKKVDNTINYSFVNDGLKAKELLESDNANPYKKAKLILLDYNLPGISGMQLLDKIRSENSMKHTPVVVFSSSDNPQDIKNAYKHGANAYVVKPIGMANLKDTIQTVCDFWLNKNQRC
ncbi:MAG: response regulator [Sphingobacteriales bacterium]|nr:MAG: response regulator [Sphingobacteriales bacterium]